MHSRRSSLPVRALFAAGVVALAAAGCASEGVTPGPVPASGATGSPTASLPASATSALAAASSSTSDSASDQGSSSDSPSDPATSLAVPDSSSSAGNPPGKVYKLTDTVTEGGFRLKIHSITMPFNPPAGSDFTPGPTRVWLLLDFEVTNVGDQQMMFSTIGAFDMRDSTNASYLTSIVANDELPQTQVFQDHEMKPGDTSHGVLVFDLSERASGYQLIFNGNMWHATGTPPRIAMGR